MIRCKICNKLIEELNSTLHARAIEHLERCHFPDYKGYKDKHPNTKVNEVVQEFYRKVDAT